MFIIPSSLWPDSCLSYTRGKVGSKLFKGKTKQKKTLLKENSYQMLIKEAGDIWKSVMWVFPPNYTYMDVIGKDTEK